MTIRPATVADVPALVALGQRFLAESSYAGKLVDNPAQMAATAEGLMANPAGAVLLAEDRGGALTGTIGLLCFVHHFSGLLTVGECFFFVEPVARGTVGVRLLKAAQTWAIAQGAQEFQVVAPEGADRVEALYQALKFAPIERAWGLAL